MGKSRLAALVLAALIVALGLMRTATASHEASHQAFSGGATFKGLVVKTERDVTNITSINPSWTTVDSRGFQIPAGESQLIVVDFSAETTCSGTAGFWCSARVLVGESLDAVTELEPAEGIGFLIDTAGSPDGHEGHAMSRALCVRNPTGSPMNVSVWLQATKVTSDVTSFELDDWTFKIARNAPCSPFVDI